MKKNMNKTERVMRAVGGSALASMAFLGPANPIFLIGLIPLATGLVGSCPLYSALHVSSTKDELKGSDSTYFHQA